MKMPNAWLGRTIFMFIPILSLCVWIDTFLLHANTAESGTESGIVLSNQFEAPLSV
jgi:hypothetical protein